jgi:hypothetical protein
MAAPAQREVPLDLLPRLRIARDHVDAHFAEALDLDRLAAVAGAHGLGASSTSRSGPASS